MPETKPPQHSTLINDLFWSPRLEMNATRAIDHQWEQLRKTGCFENFRLVADHAKGIRLGFFFADSDAYKWLEAAARVYATHPSSKLKGLMDDLIDLIGRTQEEDGYIFTYNQFYFPDIRWQNLQIEHELYCHGHLIEAAVSHYQVTTEDKLLKIAIKAADLMVDIFSSQGPRGTPGHEEIELALIRLYQVTGGKPYAKKNEIECHGSCAYLLPGRFAGAIVHPGTPGREASLVAHNKRRLLAASAASRRRLLEKVYGISWLEGSDPVGRYQRYCS